MSHNSKKTGFDKRRVDITEVGREGEIAGVNHCHCCPVWRDDKEKDRETGLTPGVPFFT